MEEVPGPNKVASPFDWRTSVSPDRFTEDEQKQLDQIAELAVNVDFEEIAEQRKSGRVRNHPEDPGLANPVDEMIVWAYAKQIITAEEVRNLQKKLYST